MLGDHALPVRGLAFSPDSQILLTASDDGHMKLYDINSLRTSVAGMIIKKCNKIIRFVNCILLPYGCNGMPSCLC